MELNHHVIDSPDPLPGESRTDTIARARNLAKTAGTEHYAMFLDDYVVLPPSGIQRIIHAFVFNRSHAAIGIDYQKYVQPYPWAPHIAMGAVVFLLPILEQIHFRTEPNKCECLCCCEDIRRMGYRIDYLPGAQGKHLK